MLLTPAHKSEWVILGPSLGWCLQESGSDSRNLQGISFHQPDAEKKSRRNMESGGPCISASQSSSQLPVSLQLFLQNVTLWQPLIACLYPWYPLFHDILLLTDDEYKRKNIALKGLFQGHMAYEEQGRSLSRVIQLIHLKRKATPRRRIIKLSLMRMLVITPVIFFRPIP